MRGAVDDELRRDREQSFALDQPVGAQRRAGVGQIDDDVAQPDFGGEFDVAAQFDDFGGHAATSEMRPRQIDIFGGDDDSRAAAAGGVVIEIGFRGGDQAAAGDSQIERLQNPGQRLFGQRVAAGDSRLRGAASDINGSVRSAAKNQARAFLRRRRDQPPACIGVAVGERARGESGLGEQRRDGAKNATFRNGESEHRQNYTRRRRVDSACVGFCSRRARGDYDRIKAKVMSLSPRKVAVTGAAGQIGYALIFRIAAGGLFGENTPVRLSLIETPNAKTFLDGVEMELLDCAFPLLVGIDKTADPETGFADADAVFLIGARPRSAGMERKDLLEANAEIFSTQGRALQRAACATTRVLVVGNPANTNCLIARANAPALPDQNWSAMTRLDDNRLRALLAAKAGAAVGAVRNTAIWGNHSSTQFPDIFHATIDGQSAADLAQSEWYRQTLIPAVQQRGAAVIKARGASSAASAANAALAHMRDWLCGGDANDWQSMAVVSQGEYEIEQGLVYSYPTTCADGGYRVAAGLSIDDFAREKMRASENELRAERDAVRHLLP